MQSQRNKYIDNNDTTKHYFIVDYINYFVQKTRTNMLRLIKFKYFFFIIITIITFGLDLIRFMRYGCIPTSLNECKSVMLYGK